MGSTAVRKLSRLFGRIASLFGQKETQKVLFYLFLSVFGFAASNMRIFVSYAPFGVSLLCAAENGSVFSALLGVFFGYLLGGRLLIPARYVAAMIVALSVRWTLSKFEKVRERPWYAPGIAFLACCSTGFTIALTGSPVRHGLLMYFSESLLCAAGAYFFRRVFLAASGGKALSEFDLSEIAGVGFAAGVFCLSFSSVTVFSASVSKILLCLALLTVSRQCGIGGGCIVGACISLLQSLNYIGIREISGVYAISGLFTGIFAPLSRPLGALVLALSVGVFSLQLGSEAAFLSSIYEAIAAGIAFSFLPLKGAERTEKPETARLYRLFSHRLYLVAGAIENVSGALTKVSDRLSRLRRKNEDDVFEEAVTSFCSGCGMSLYCWGEHFSENTSHLRALRPVLREKSVLIESDFPPEFLSVCSRRAALAGKISACWLDHLAGEAALLRAREIREIVSDQFSNLSLLLRDLADRTDFDFSEDAAAQDKLSRRFSHDGIPVKELICWRKNEGSLHISGTLLIPQELEGEEKNYLERALFRVFRRDFSVKPEEKNGALYFSAQEKPRIAVSWAAASHNSRGGSLSGDSYSVFRNEEGCFTAILSDGMGTGARAAVDGAMATGIMEELLKNGVGFDSALKIANSALLSKSSDESLATLDIASVDLSSGELTLLKAGAPMSYLLKGGEAKELFSPALPAGILGSAEFSKLFETVGAGDILVLLTDGLLSSDSKWIPGLIEACAEDSAQHLADELLRCALDLRYEGRDDDCTVLVFEFKNAEDQKTA